MEDRTKRIVAKAAAVSGMAVVATYAISLSVRTALAMPFDWLAWIECFVIPVAIGMPVASYIFWQSERLAETCTVLTQSEAKLKAANAALAYRASHDGMTGLLNREAFLARLTAFIRNEEEAVLLLIDADNFKQINDRFGHTAGDEALRAISKALQQAVGPHDIVGRIGGEEFGIILMGCDVSHAEETAEHIRSEVEHRASLSARLDRYTLTVSIGATATLAHGSDCTAVLREADRCLYEAKRQGRNQVSFTYSATAVA